MKIAVTGGAGFIASHITDAYIDAGHEVVIIDNLSTGKRSNINPKAKFVQADLNDDSIKELFLNEKFDIVNHHAAQMSIRISVDDPRFDANNNILGALNLFEAAKASGVKKIIFASSGGAIYGEQEYFPADEKHPTAPCSPYGIAKLTTEKYLFYYKEVFGIDYVALRYANIYGPRQNSMGEAGVVAIFADKMFAGEQAIINGDGTNSRDYVFVSDVVKANMKALGDDVSGYFNICTGIEHDVNFIFKTLKELTGADTKEVHADGKKGEQKRSVLTYKKFNNSHGWKPTVVFANGLKTTVDFFRLNKLK